MIRVAYITNATPRSGVGYRAEKIAHHLGQYPEVSLTKYLIDSERGALFENQQEVYRQYSLPGVISSKPISWLRLGRRLRKHLQQQPTSIWHATNQTLSFMVHRSQPAVVTVHDLIELLEPQSWAGGILAHYLYRGIKEASHIIAVSHYTAQTLQKHLAIPREKITVIHNGVDSDFHPIDNFRSSLAYHTLAQELKITSDHQVVLYVGSDHPRKNVVTALRAAGQVMAKNNKLIFLKVGEPGIEAGRAQLLTAIDELGLRDRVRLLGGVLGERLNELYNLADVFIYPSYFEGFGLPPLQAMAAGAPVITSTASSLPEVVGDAALLHNPDDIHAFAQSLERILTDSTEAARLREAGLARAKQFTWEQAAAAEVEVYKELS